MTAEGCFGDAGGVSERTVVPRSCSQAHTPPVSLPSPVPLGELSRLDPLGPLAELVQGGGELAAVRGGEGVFVAEDAKDVDHGLTSIFLAFALALHDDKEAVKSRFKF